MIAKIQLTGTIGQLRTIETIDGKQIIERLEAIEPAQKALSLLDDQWFRQRITPGRSTSSPRGLGASVEWRIQYRADGQPDIVVRTAISGLLNTGLESLKPRFGVPK